MSIANPTTNYAWTLPTVGGSADAWGTILNTMFGDTVTGIDAVIYALSQATLSASRLNSGTVPLAQIPSLPTTQVTSGTFADARISEASVIQHEAALIIDGTQITAGSFASGTYTFPGTLAVTTQLQIGAYSDVAATVVASTSAPSGSHRDGTIWCQYTA